MVTKSDFPACYNCTFPSWESDICHFTLVPSKQSFNLNLSASRQLFLKHGACLCTRNTFFCFCFFVCSLAERETCVIVFDGLRTAFLSYFDSLQTGTGHNEWQFHSSNLNSMWVNKIRSHVAELFTAVCASVCAHAAAAHVVAVRKNRHGVLVVQPLNTPSVSCSGSQVN